VAYQRVATTNDVEPGTVRYVEADGLAIALCNVEGEFYAIADVCTHDGGSLDQGYLDGNLVECPRHGARFDVITGRAVTLPAIRPVKTYPVKVEGDEVLVEVA
jgi:3-phenylpropionate/trans-cinnamate dioxygenase ferredoxin subunit